MDSFFSKKKFQLLAFCFWLITYSSFSFADIDTTFERRLYRLEKILDNKKDYDLLKQIDFLKEEIMQLRGQYEELNAKLENLKEQQLALYRDIDSRLNFKPKSVEASKQFENHNNREKSDSDFEQKYYPVEVELGSKETSITSYDASNNTFINDTVTSEDVLYESAYHLINNKNYDEALIKLKSYLQNYPNGHFAPNANYWLGEVYLLKQEPKQALVYFQTVIDKFPKHHKAADSKLKKGYALEAIGDIENAKQVFIEVKNEYNGTALSRLAETRLMSIKNKRDD